ncbi:hypothetical protein K1T71_010002 [Dendrolimus kikuchii]|uniref:Uncharacterized protein n=1 Tax=Dendrolimus kikuchii TaxID=765133 RepID=A0ACC1CU03_9NEOP|nr:hypothetical protein K1T71_010002 [Dendrolimus kikuchii]
MPSTTSHERPTPRASRRPSQRELACAEPSYNLCYNKLQSTSAGMSWTKTNVIKLVKEYSKRPALWNPDNDYYRNNSVKMKQWAELAGVFDSEVADIRRKLNSILACYRKQRGLVRVRGYYLWYLYGHMSFLPNYLPSRKKQGNFDIQTQHIEDDSDADSNNFESLDQAEQTEQLEESNQSNQSTNCSEEEEDEPVIIKIEPNLPIKNTQPLKRNITRITKRRPVVAKSSKLDSKMIEALKMITKTELYRKKDECDIFGEYIATSLRRHDEITRCMIKQGMNNILFEQDLHSHITSYTQDNRNDLRMAGYIVRCEQRAIERAAERSETEHIRTGSNAAEHPSDPQSRSEPYASGYVPNSLHRVQLLDFLFTFSRIGR